MDIEEDMKKFNLEYRECEELPELTHEEELKDKIKDTWRRIIDRCHIELANGRNKNYNGKGIQVCQDWRYSFKNFYKWSLDHECNLDLSIDRIDVTGNYTPMNCQWISSSENSSRRKYDYFFRGGSYE